MVKQLLFTSSISLAGIGIFCITGFLFLHALPASKRLSIRERLFFSPIFFFGYMLLTFLANWAMQGRLFSSFFLLATFFITSLLLLFFLSQKQVKETLHFLTQESQQSSWITLLKKMISSQQGAEAPEKFPGKYRFCIFIILLFAAALVSAWPLLIGERFDVDALAHLRWTNQFMNGRIFSASIPYQNHGLPPSMYPFMVHITSAFFAQIFRVEAETGIIITTVIQAVLYPLGIFFLIEKITTSFRTAILATLLACFYFGHEYLLGLWWFNIPVQRLDMANNLTRMMSMSVAPFILYLFYESIEHKRKGLWILTGLLTGIAGLIHPYFFSFIILFTLLTIIYDFLTRNQHAFQENIGVLCLALSLFSLILIPPLWDKISAANMVDKYSIFPTQLTGEVHRQVVIMPHEYLIAYGLPGFLALLFLGYFIRSTRKEFVSLLLATTILILVVTWLNEILLVSVGVALPYIPTQHKYGNTIFLVCIIMAALFIYNFAFSEKNISRWRQMGITALLLLFTCSTIPNLIAFKRYFIQRDPYFSQHNNPDSLARQIKKQLSPNSILAAPNWWTRRIASYTGYDFLYVNYKPFYTQYRYLANTLLFLAPGPQREDIEKETGLTFEEILQHVIDYFKINGLIVPKNMTSTFDQYSFTQKISEGKTHLPTVKQIEFVIYKTLPTLRKKPDNHQVITSILDNQTISRIAIGGRPLLVDHYVKPRLYNIRRKNFTSLACLGNRLFAVNTPDNYLYEIDNKNGRIINRVTLSEQPYAITGYKQSIYIYFWKSDYLRKINLNGINNIEDVGPLVAPQGRVGDIAADNEGRVWFFSWSSREKSFFLYYYNQKSKKMTKMGQLPRNKVYTGISYDKNQNALLLSTRKGFYFRWDFKQKQITSRFHNGRINPSGICADETRIYAYNSANHLIGVLKPAETLP